MINDFLQAIEPYLFEIAFGVCNLVLLLIRTGKKRLKQVVSNNSIIEKKSDSKLDLTKNDYFIELDGREVLLNDKQIYSRRKE